MINSPTIELLAPTFAGRRRSVATKMDFEKGHFWVPAALKFVIITY